MAEAYDDTGEPKTTVADLPKELLVSIFMAVEHPLWVRHTVPCVCKEWNEIYRSKDASPLHEELVVWFEEEVSWAAAEPRRERDTVSSDDESDSGAKKDEKEDEEDDEEEDDEDDESEDEEWERSVAVAAREGRGRRGPVAGARRRSVVHASRVISWAKERAGSVRTLELVKKDCFNREALKAFRAKDLGRLVAVVGPSLTEISMGPSLGDLCKARFWKSLRDHVVPAGRLRSLVVEGIKSFFNEIDGVIDFMHANVERLDVVAPLGKLAGSLEDLMLTTDRLFEDRGLPRFPESFLALKKLRWLVLAGHPITAIPAGILSLKKLEELDLSCCRLSSLPKELGELSRLTKLTLSTNRNLGSTLPADEAFPADLKKMKSLRELYLNSCGLRTVPAFVGGLESLEVLHLGNNCDLQLEAFLDLLIEGFPRLREVNLWSVRMPWAHLEAFKAKSLAKNPNANVCW